MSKWNFSTRRPRSSRLHKRTAMERQSNFITRTFSIHNSNTTSFPFNTLTCNNLETSKSLRQVDNGIPRACAWKLYVITPIFKFKRKFNSLQVESFNIKVGFNFSFLSSFIASSINVKLNYDHITWLLMVTFCHAS